jgi:protein gp37
MGEYSKIEWTDHTFNPWTGCTKISPACDHCYAEAWSKRTGLVRWENHPRGRTTESYWKEPIKWNARAFKREHGHWPRVFCASLADLFDNQVPLEWRGDLFALIRECPRLDWLLLTKRPQNIKKMLPSDWGAGSRMCGLA